MSGDETQAEEHGGGHDAGELDGASLILLFVIITLTLGMIAREITKRTGFPYTPLLIVIGGVLGAAPVFGDITKSSDYIMLINPHAILILLLPLLIFESAYNSHTEVLSKNFWQVMLLVGPGVLMQTFFLGFVLYTILGYGGDGEYDMSFESCLVLGTILATTDPVAVVALLKELGAPLHIETLIEMESLFNDGVAMVFFQIFVKLAQGEHMTVGGAIGQFVLMAFGGPLVGLGFGILALIILKYFTRGTTLFISLVVLLAYSTFLAAEKFLEGKVSGLLALVICGIVMNIYAKDYMTNKQKTAVGFILSYLQYVSETILFFMSGVFIGDILINGSDDSHDEKSAIEGADWWKMFVLYLFVNLGRICMFVIMMYPLKKTGEGMSWKEAWVAIWGGLRGALALALGLIIYADDPNSAGINKKTQNLILFHVCGIATGTLLINGSSCGKFVESLGLISNTSVKMKFKQKYLKSVKEEAIRQRKILNSNSYFDMVEWKGVDDLINLKELESQQGWKETIQYDTDYKPKKNIQRRTIQNNNGINLAHQDSKDLKTENPLNGGDPENGRGFKRLGTMAEKELKKDIGELKSMYSEEKYQKLRYEHLRIFMKMISFTKSKEWISTRVFQLIFDAAEENTEKVYKPIRMWHLLQENLASEKKIYYLSKCSNLPFKIGSWVNYWFHLELEQIHEMVYIFTTCINDTKSFIKDHSVNIHDRNIIRTKDMNIIMKELDDDFYQAKSFMRKIKKNYFEVLGKLEQRKAAIKIIMAQAKMVDEHINTHYIPEKEGNEIKNYLSSKIEKLNSIGTLVSLTSQSEDKIKIFFKDTLEQNELSNLLNNQINLKFEEGEEILGLDEEAQYIYFIAQGEIEEIIYPVEDAEQTEHNKSSIIFTQGQVVGITNLVDPDEKSLITLVAKEQTNATGLPLNELREYYFNNGSFEEFCLKKCLFQFLHLSQKDNDLWTQFGSKNIDEINEIAQDARCVRLEEEETIKIEHGGYLYMGVLQSQDGNIQVDNYSLLTPGQYYIAQEISILLEFSRKQRKVAILEHQPLNPADNRGFKQKRGGRGNEMDTSMSMMRQRQKSNQQLPNQTAYGQSHFQKQANGIQRENSVSYIGTAPNYTNNNVIVHNGNGVQNGQTYNIQTSQVDQKPQTNKIHSNRIHIQKGMKNIQEQENDGVGEEMNNVKNVANHGDDGNVVDGSLSPMSVSKTNTYSTNGQNYKQGSIRNKDQTMYQQQEPLNIGDVSMISMNHQDSEQTSNYEKFRKGSFQPGSSASLHARRNSHDNNKIQIMIDRNNELQMEKAAREDQHVKVIKKENGTNDANNKKNVDYSESESESDLGVVPNNKQQSAPIEFAQKNLASNNNGSTNNNNTSGQKITVQMKE